MTTTWKNLLHALSYPRSCPLKTIFMQFLVLGRMGCEWAEVGRWWIMMMCHDRYSVRRISPHPKLWQPRNHTFVISKVNRSDSDAFRILYTSLAQSMSSYFPTGSCLQQDISLVSKNLSNSLTKRSAEVVSIICELRGVVGTKVRTPRKWKWNA